MSTMSLFFGLFLYTSRANTYITIEFNFSSPDLSVPQYSILSTRRYSLLAAKARTEARPSLPSLDVNIVNQCQFSSDEEAACVKEVWYQPTKNSSFRTKSVFTSIRLLFPDEYAELVKRISEESLVD
ncbi:hypothetical protein K435DRAFT_851996 [Dendrothele bispora CBS 962.96]|uniref:Uncharacterized protein n=1 Tax=Dendrothele bispora (strain CBS 962.96) TaxID=1314807 RepID=A0A4S8MKU0_DENBC|nr:hypothetical protein K435DRAFT_851996 [Dendrothele bispora CBS 962.96]